MLTRKQKQEKYLRAVRNILVLLIILCILGLLLIYIETRFDSPREAARMIQDTGILGPFLVVLLIVLEVIVAPIPGYLIAVASGYAFGAVLGAVYSYLGNVIGTAIAFWLSRKFGRPFVEHLINRKKLQIYDGFFREKATLLLWITYLFPVFPSDIVAFVTGLSNFRFRKFITIVCIAYLPNMLLLNYLGASLYEYGIQSQTIFYGALLLLVLLFGWLFYFYLRKRV